MTVRIETLGRRFHLSSGEIRHATFTKKKERDSHLCTVMSSFSHLSFSLDTRSFYIFHLSVASFSSMMAASFYEKRNTFEDTMSVKLSHL